MRLVTVTALVLTLTACGTDERSSRSEVLPSAAVQVPVAPGGWIAPSNRGIAAMEDRGTFNAFALTRATRQQAGVTLHPVQLSETHAIAASAEGRSLRFVQPDGEVLEVPFERTEEGLDGNWTWIGRTANGLDAVITFGQDAVFGSIARADGPALRITTEGGATWLAVTGIGGLLDGDLTRDIGNPDILIPDRLIKAAAQRKQSAAAEGAIPTKNAANTVDVVLGYTNGMVTKFGSTNAAVTRLTNLIALTNQAYVNSLVTPRVRLVHTLQVPYTDSNSNEVALEALTGYACDPSCSPITVPAELVPLRTARDTFGADLVSLVRPFQTPQHDGCGIAWLLGGGGFAIDNSDAPFGYSVVSDGNDVDETDGKTYGCREATLAHEMGHNMGQTHNLEDAGSSGGTHSYSYGYRETASTGFYTIMAYRLANSSQFTINYFGNPSVNEPGSGRPTGTATADNARSLNISMPLVAQFRNTVVPFAGRARNDFNGDGKSDIGLFNQSLGYFAYWIMNGTIYTGSAGFTVNNYTPVMAGFTSSISQANVLANEPGTRTLRTYTWNGSTHAAITIGGYASGWTVIGQGDMDGDGNDDIFWRNASTGEFSVWRMNGAVFLGGQSFYPPSTYLLIGISDFNGDDRVDLLWNDPGTRNASIWLSTGTNFQVEIVGQYGTDWNMIGTADVTGDGKAEILLRDNANVYLAYWRMNGAVYQGSTAVGLAADRQLFTTGDFDGDGIEDLVISRPSDRRLFLWRSNGNLFTESNIGQYGTDWAVLK